MTDLTVIGSGSGDSLLKPNTSVENLFLRGAPPLALVLALRFSTIWACLVRRETSGVVRVGGLTGNREAWAPARHSDTCVEIYNGSRPKGIPTKLQQLLQVQAKPLMVASSQSWGEGGGEKSRGISLKVAEVNG